MEGHLSAIALWYRLTGALGLASSGILLLSVLLLANNTSGPVLVVLIGFSGFWTGSFLLGRHLDRYSNRARIIAGVLGALGVATNVFSTLGVVIQATRGAAPTWMALFFSAHLALGSLWSGANLWALFNQRAAVICTPEYRALIVRKPMQRPHTYSSPFFWLPFVWMGLAFVGSIAMYSIMASFAARLS